MIPLKQLIIFLKKIFAPIDPKDWWGCAKRIAAADRWGAPLLLWSLAAFVVIVNIGFGRQQNLPWLGGFNLFGIGSWVVIALLATTITSIRSGIAFRRLGLFGPSRPRWWFEVSALCVNAVAVGSAGLMMGVLLDNPQQQFPTWLFTVLLLTIGFASLGFLVAATTGYFVSVVTGKPRTGRAYDCTHYLYVILVPLGLLTYAAMQAPPQAFFPVGVIPVIAGILGIGGLFWGILSIDRRFEARERRRESARLTPDSNESTAT